MRSSVDAHGEDTLVRNPVNGGYGLAASQGLARADAPWALLANPDLVVSPRFFGHLLEAARSAPAAVATLVPEMRYAARPDIVNCRGLTMDAAGIPAEIDAGQPADVAPTENEPLGGSSGCCLLRLESVRQLGGLELVYFAYLEDVDLAVRLARAGHRSRLVSDAVAWHQGSASAGPVSPLKTFSWPATAGFSSGSRRRHHGPCRAPAGRPRSRDRVIDVLVGRSAVARPARCRPTASVHRIRARGANDKRRSLHHSPPEPSGDAPCDLATKARRDRRDPPLRRPRRSRPTGGSHPTEGRIDRPPPSANTEWKPEVWRVASGEGVHIRGESWGVVGFVRMFRARIACCVVPCFPAATRRDVFRRNR